MNIFQYFYPFHAAHRNNDEVNTMQTLCFDTTPAASLHLLLNAHQLISLRNVRNTAMELSRGSAWVTFERDGLDYFLKAGERLRLPDKGRAVIEALEDADLQILSTSEQPLAQAGADVLPQNPPSGTKQTYPPGCWRNTVRPQMPERVGLEMTF
jgi:hypothetical protein